MALDFIEETLSGDQPILKFKLPQQLEKDIDLTLNQQPCSQKQLIDCCKDILQHQVKPYHPHFHNQLFGGFDQFSVMGAMLAPCINGTVFTYQVSSCWTLMEKCIFQKLRTLIKWENIDGTFTPGGSFANFMAIPLARHCIYPEGKYQGFYNCKPFKIFTSQVAHYSLKKGAILCGIGIQNIVPIKCDVNCRMICSQLQKAIEQCQIQGNTPLMVMATVGTTVQGAIDPINQIGQICARHKIWFHVDAAFGGAFIMSPNLINKIGSFTNADSITWDPHKALIVPLQSTLFLCKHIGLLKKCNETKADYLFHRQRLSYDSCLDVGDKSLQCGRVIDVLKLWTYFKGNGWKNVARHVQMQHELALYVKKYINNNQQRWKLAIQSVDTFNVCFWYIPIGLSWTENEKDLKYLSHIAVIAKKIMIQDAKILIGYSSSRSPYYFWRTVMSNPFINQAHVQKQMTLIAKYCEQALQIMRKQ